MVLMVAVLSRLSLRISGMGFFSGGKAASVSR